ncbi:MAG: flagellar M-ring protein FliF [Deltaproteobacteria bacterium]|nr:MAG: flagellar M-ring protein FliF [Deltaproteobacteria bacterium]
MDRLKKLVVDLKTRYLALPAGPRLIYTAAAAAAILALVLLVMISSRTDYAVLFSNLTQEDAGAIIGKLKAQKVPYQVDGGGTSIMVPKSQVYDLRLSLASEGLPQGGGVGFELFDKQTLGTTEFVQRLNFQRALQGELARTICRFPEIAEARVHIVTPKDSLFVEDQEEPSAAVVLKLRPGRTLSQAQLDGIINLVASSVEGLSPGQVTVVDMTGKILSKPQDALGAGRLTNAQIEYQQQVESALKAKVQSMLDKILGPNQSIVRVSADIDFQQVSINEDRYTPDPKLIRSEQLTVEQKSLTAAAGGIPESRYNLNAGTVTPNRPGQGPPPLTAPLPAPETKPRQGRLERKSEIRNYEINRVNRQVVEYPGNIKRLSVAVVVDGIYPKSGGKKDRNAQFSPRPSEEMQNLARIVKKAIGYNRDRGDQFEISCIPLAPTFMEAGLASLTPEMSWSEMLMQHLKIGLLVFLVLVVLMFLMRRRRHRGVPTALEPPPVRELPPTLDDLGHALPSSSMAPDQKTPSPAGLALPETIEGKSKASQLLNLDPERAVEVLRLWLYDKGKGK